MEVEVTLMLELGVEVFSIFLVLGWGEGDIVEVEDGTGVEVTLMLKLGLKVFSILPVLG